MIDKLQALSSWTLWHLKPNQTPGKKPLKVACHVDGVTNHRLREITLDDGRILPPNPAPPLDFASAVMFRDLCHAQGKLDVGIGFRPQPEHKLFCLDIDDCIDGHGHLNEMAQRFVAFFSGAAIERSWSGRGLHIWASYSCESPGRRGKSNGVEVYAEGQFIALGTPLGGSAWVDCTQQLQWVIENYFPERGAASARTDHTEWESLPEGERQRVLAELASALKFHDPDSRPEWVAAGMALSALGEDGYHLWADWSATSTKFPGGEGLDEWDTFTGDRTGYQAIFKRAQERGWANPRAGGSLLAAFGKADALDTLDGQGQMLAQVSATGKKVDATVSEVAGVLRKYPQVIRAGFDEFKQQICISWAGGDWQVADKQARVRLVELLELSGFKSVPDYVVKDTLILLGHQNRFDSAIDWANRLVWDGVPRVATMCRDFFGCEDTPYARAVGTYLMTALAGRCLQPGVQADMAPIFVGTQGQGKSRTLLALVPEPESYVSVNLRDSHRELALHTKGRLMVELPEMKGMRNSDIESVRDWMSRSTDRWRGMGADDISSVQRRFVCIGNANDRDVLHDPDGNRRWLPIDAGRCDPAGMAAVRDQLWAEGVALFRAHGIAWQEAEARGKAVHKDFEATDAWEGAVDRFLAAYPPPGIAADSATTWGAVAFTVEDVLRYGVCMPTERINRAAEMRVGKILRDRGYSKRRRLYRGQNTNWWTKSSN